MKHIFRTLAACGAIALAAPAAMADIGDVQQSGTVAYVSGGIGVDEADAFKAASGNWPLALEFSVAAQPRAQYASDVSVHIAARGRSVLDTTTDGPYLLVKLPPGAYTVSATFHGKTVTRQVAVKRNGSAHASIMWPASADVG